MPGGMTGGSRQASAGGRAGVGASKDLKSGTGGTGPKSGNGGLGGGGRPSNTPSGPKAGSGGPGRGGGPGGTVTRTNYNGGGNFGSLSPPQQQTHGVYNRALSDSQLGNPQMGSPNSAGYRAAISNAIAMGGNPMTQIDNTYRGLGLKDLQRSALLGRNYVESNHFDPSVFNGTMRGDGGLAYGLGQWHPDRAPAINNFIKGIGQPLNSPAAQAGGIIDEMQNRPETALNSYKHLLNADNPQQAMAALNEYERPKNFRGYNANQKNVAGYGDAMGFMGNYNPQPQTQVANIDPAMDGGGGVAPAQVSMNGDGTAAPQSWGGYLSDKLGQGFQLAKEAGQTFTNANQAIQNTGGANGWGVALAKMFGPGGTAPSMGDNRLPGTGGNQPQGILSADAGHDITGPSPTPSGPYSFPANNQTASWTNPQMLNPRTPAWWKQYA